MHSVTDRQTDDITMTIADRVACSATVRSSKTDGVCYMRSHSVTFHPTQVNTPRQRPVLDSPNPVGWKAELALSCL